MKIKGNKPQKAGILPISFFFFFGTFQHGVERGGDSQRIKGKASPLSLVYEWLGSLIKPLEVYLSTGLI